MSGQAAAKTSSDVVSQEFTSVVPFTEEWGDTLVLYCTDPRYRRQTHEFLHHHLGLQNPAVITIPGGVAPLLPLVGFAHKLAKGWLDLLFQHHRPSRIVCVAHEDCAAYKVGKHQVINAVVQHLTGGTVHDLQRKHLHDARITLQTWFHGVIVEIYFAEVQAGADGIRRVTFTKAA